MKKTIILLFSMIILLSGCGKTEQGLKINKDNSITYNNKLLIKSEILKEKKDERQIEENFNQVQLDYENKGFEFSRLEENDMIGFNVSKQFKDIDSVHRDEDINFKVKSNKTNYYILETYDMEISVPGNYVSGSKSGTLPIGDKRNKTTFKVMLPYSATKSNADVEKGKTLIWNLDYQKEENNLTFSYIHYGKWFMHTLIGMGILILSLIGLFIHWKRNRYYY